MEAEESTRATALPVVEAATAEATPRWTGSAAAEGCLGGGFLRERTGSLAAPSLVLVHLQSSSFVTTIHPPDLPLALDPHHYCSCLFEWKLGSNRYLAHGNPSTRAFDPTKIGVYPSLSLIGCMLCDVKLYYFTNIYSA